MKVQHHAYLHFEETIWKLKPQQYLRFLYEALDAGNGYVLPNAHRLKFWPTRTIGKDPDGTLFVHEAREPAAYLVPNLELTMMNPEAIQHEIEEFLRWWIDQPD